jgi:hypothetical protein
MKIEDGINKFIATNLNSIVASMGKHSTYVMDHSPIQDRVKGMRIEIIEDDPYYSNKVVNGSNIGLGSNVNYRYTGYSELKIFINMDTNAITIADFRDEIKSMVSLHDIFFNLLYKTVFKYTLGGDFHQKFFNISILLINNKDEVFANYGINNYDDYNWDDVENDNHPYWKKVD